MDNQYANSQPAYKARLKNDIRKTGAAILKTVHPFWYPKQRQANSRKIDRETAQLLSLEYQRHPDQYTKSDVIRLMQEPIFYTAHREAFCKIAAEFRQNPAGFTESDRQRLMKIPAFRELNPEAFIASDIQRLADDLGCLENLHAQRAMGHAQVGGSIAKLYANYAAKNTEECLQKMALLAAYCYEMLGEKNPDSPTAQATEIRNLETRI